MRKTLLLKKSLVLFACSPLAFAAVPLSSYKTNFKDNEEMSTALNIAADLDTIKLITDGSPRGSSFEDLKKGKVGDKEIPNGDFWSYTDKQIAWPDKELFDNPIDRSGIRLGGGLIFDLPYDDIASTELKENMEKGETFTTKGFISSNGPETQHPELGDLVAEQTVNESTFGAAAVKNGHLNFAKNLSVTPNEGPSNTPIMQKKAFLELFNLELFVWYWKNWTAELNVDDPKTTNANLAAANSLETDFFQKSKLVNSPEINISLAWNQVKEGNPTSGGEKLGKSIVNATMGAMLGLAITNPLAGAIFGGLASVGLDFLTADTKPQNTKNIGDYYSQYLDSNFWRLYFSKYLGTPDQPNNKIWDFYNKYNYLPSQIKMEDFDIELSNIELKSDYEIINTQANEAGTKWGTNYDSNSTIDLSNLEIGLNTDITLQKESPDIQKMLAKLDGEKIYIYTSDISSMNTADEQTAAEIRRVIAMKAPELDSFRNGLTFTNQLVANESVPINVFYNGIPQNIDFKIHLKT